VVKKRTIFWPVIIIILIVLVLSGLFVYSECQKLKAVRNLEVSFVSAEVEKLSLTKMTVGFTIKIVNPNDVDVTVGVFKANIFGNDVFLTKIEFPSVNLSSKESLQSHFSVNLNYLDIGSVILQAIKQKQLVWMIKGEYVLELPFGFKYPYSFEMTYVSK
jgi:LEA14-like dessication related protein